MIICLKKWRLPHSEKWRHRQHGLRAVRCHHAWGGQEGHPERAPERSRSPGSGSPGGASAHWRRWGWGDWLSHGTGKKARSLVGFPSGVGYVHYRKHIHHNRVHTRREWDSGLPPMVWHGQRRSSMLRNIRQMRILPAKNVRSESCGNPLGWWSIYDRWVFHCRQLRWWIYSLEDWRRFGYFVWQYLVWTVCRMVSE